MTSAGIPKTLQPAIQKLAHKIMEQTLFTQLTYIYRHETMLVHAVKNLSKFIHAASRKHPSHLDSL